MAQPDDTSAILRRATAGAGTRRLSGIQAAAPQPAEPLPAATQQQQLATLRSAFQDELAQLREEARQEGLQTGRQEAAKELAETLSRSREELARQLQQTEQTLRQASTGQCTALAGLVAALQQRSLELTTAMEPVLGRLALGMVTKLLGRHMQAHSLIADLASQAIKEYRLSEPLRILVSPTDYAVLHASRLDEALLALFQIDHEALAGSCLIDFGSGQLDAGVDTQWAALKELLSAPSEGEHRVGEA